MTQVSHLNTTDIRAAIELGCQTMGSVFNADDNHIPFFGSLVRPEAWLRFNASHSEAHVPGRHLNALLTAEDLLGLSIDTATITTHMRAAFFAYSGPVPLPLNRTTIDGPLIRFLPHNIREGFHALYALVRYRGSRKARQLAEASIQCIAELWDPQTGWNRQRLEGHYGLEVIEWDSPFMTGLARAIGPLVKFYRATGYEPAKELAIVLKDKAIADYFTLEGQYDYRIFGTHVHSTTCVLSSLAQLAELTGDTALMQRVKAFYDTGLKQISDALGWSIENSHPNAPADRGEANNTGDILETALILGRAVDPRYYHHAERILRGHLLPSQLRDISFIHEPPNPHDEDGKRDVARRHLGAFGFPAPYGHQPLDVTDISFNMDIVGGAVASLCEAYRAVVQTDEAGVWVNLLFDHETEAIRIDSPYTYECLCVTTKRPGPVYVRIPPWLNHSTIQLDRAWRIQGDYLVIAEPTINQAIHIRFPLPQHTIELVHRTRTIQVQLQGDRVLAMSNFGVDLTFFDPLIE